MSNYKGSDAWDDTKLTNSPPQDMGPSPASEGRHDHYELGNVMLGDTPPPKPKKTQSMLAWFLLMLGLVGLGLFVALVFLPLRQQTEHQAQILAAAQATNEALTKQVSTLEQKRAELEATQAELSVTVQLKEQALTELTRAQEELAEKLEQEISVGDVLIKQRDGQLVVDLMDQILFDSGEAELNEQGKSVLAKVGDTFVKMKDKAIQVGGHTDDVPISDKLRSQFPSNWELSTTRATNVVRFLQDVAKVPGSRLVAAGFSQYRPTTSNHTKAGRKKNRRIELVLLAPAK